jgi:uncharacterized protein (DUF58 family)
MGGMRINNRFYAVAVIAALLFILWLIFFDILLLSLWIGFLLVIIFSWIISNNSLKDIGVKRFSRKNLLEIGAIFDERLEIKNNSKITKFSQKLALEYLPASARIKLVSLQLRSS